MSCSRCGGRSLPERHPILALGRRRGEAGRLVPPTRPSFSLFLQLVVPEPGSDRSVGPHPALFHLLRVPTPHLGRPEWPWVRVGASGSGEDQPGASAGGRVARTPLAGAGHGERGVSPHPGRTPEPRRRAEVEEERVDWEDPREEGRERREGGEAREK